LFWKLLTLSAALTLLACGPAQVPPPESEPAPRVRPDGYTDERWGQDLIHQQGCVSCHALQQPSTLAPAFDSMAGGTRTFQDGSTVEVEGAAGEDYLRESITSPSTRVVAGFDAYMPRYAPNEAELAALVAFIHCFGEGACEQIAACSEVDPCRPR